MFDTSHFCTYLHLSRYLGGITIFKVTLQISLHFGPGGMLATSLGSSLFSEPQRATESHFIYFHCRPCHPGEREEWE